MSPGAALYPAAAICRRRLISHVLPGLKMFESVTTPLTDPGSNQS